MVEPTNILQSMAHSQLKGQTQSSVLSSEPPNIQLAKCQSPIHKCVSFLEFGYYISAKKYVQFFHLLHLLYKNIIPPDISPILQKPAGDHEIIPRRSPSQLTTTRVQKIIL